MTSINLVYFAWVRERIGRGNETRDIPAGIETARDLIDYEDRFAFDINRDGKIGHVVTPIERDGVGLSSSTEDGYRIVDGATTHTVAYQGAPVGPATFPGWRVLSASYRWVATNLNMMLAAIGEG